MTAAARALGTNTATVLRRIDRLTEAAGEPIFLRDNTQ
jgi:DNA-binding transcriptional LysR family regulator